MDIQNRVVNFYKNNQFIQKYLKGIDQNTNEVVLNINGEDKNVSIDTLESFKSEEEMMSFFQGGAQVSPVSEVAQVVEEPSIDVQDPTPSISAEQPIINHESLNDIKILTEIKNKDGLDNMLKKFAINDSTGLIDVNKAISVITRNTMDEVEKCIKNGFVFNNDLTKYDIDGKYIGEPTPGVMAEDTQIASSFNNVMVYLDASKMYPDQVNYNEEQIKTFMQTYISKVKEELHGNNGAVPVAQATPQTEVNNQPAPVQQDIQQVPSTANAGFADIFVLTVIVLVYAVIIINLVLKIK